MTKLDSKNKNKKNIKKLPLKKHCLVCMQLLTVEIFAVTLNVKSKHSCGSLYCGAAGAEYIWYD